MFAGPWCCSIRSQTANATLSIASLLIDALAVQFPKLCGAVRDALSVLLEQLAEEVCELCASVLLTAPFMLRVMLTLMNLTDRQTMRITIHESQR